MSTLATEYRYGPVGLPSPPALIALVKTAAWMWLLYCIADLYLFGIATVLVVASGFVMSHRGGSRAAQIGRGMLIGYLATPLTIALAVIPSAILNQLLHRV